MIRPFCFRFRISFPLLSCVPGRYGQASQSGCAQQRIVSQPLPSRPCWQFWRPRQSTDSAPVPYHQDCPAPVRAGFCMFHEMNILLCVKQVKRKIWLVPFSLRAIPRAWEIPIRISRNAPVVRKGCALPLECGRGCDFESTTRALANVPPTPQSQSSRNCHLRPCRDIIGTFGVFRSCFQSLSAV